MKVYVDTERCVGHGRCYELVPEVYDEDEYGHCRLISVAIRAQDEERARRGAVNCPEHAIRIEEELDP